MIAQERSAHVIAHGALGRPSADEQAQQDVCASLLATPRLDASRLGVSLSETGELELTGQVRSERQRDLALRVARRAAAGRSVRSQLELARPPSAPVGRRGRG